MSNKAIIIILVLLYPIFIIQAPALANNAQKDEAQEYFQEWKKSYDEGRFSESIILIKKAIELDPAYRGMANAYIIEDKKKRMMFERVEMDPLLKRKIRQGQHLKRMKAVKEAFDISMTEGFIFDTNPFRKHQNIKNDFIIATVPHIGITLGNPDAGLDVLNLSYTLYYYAHMKHSNQNRFDHLFNFDFKVPSLLSMFGKKITLNVRDYFHPGTYYSSQEDEKYRYQIYNEIETEVALPMTQKTSISMDYEHDIQYYIRDTYKPFNYQKNLLMPAFYYHVTPKTSIFGGYTFGVVDYYAGGTYESHFNIIRGGVVGELTPKSSIRLDTGYEFRNYHDEPEDKDTDRYVLDLIYTNRLSSRSTITAYGERTIRESTYSINPYYISTLGGLMWRHLLTPKLTLSLSGLLMHNKYPKEVVIDTATNEIKRRRDWYYNINSGLLYKITGYLETNLKYDLMQRVSNVDDQKYIDHVFTTDITVRY